MIGDGTVHWEAPHWESEIVWASSAFTVPYSSQDCDKITPETSWNRRGKGLQMIKNTRYEFRPWISEKHQLFSENLRGEYTHRKTAAGAKETWKLLLFFFFFKSSGWYSLEDMELDRMEWNKIGNGMGCGIACSEKSWEMTENVMKKNFKMRLGKMDYGME